MSRTPRQPSKPSPILRVGIAAGLVVAVAGYAVTHAGGEAPDDSWQTVELDVEGLDCAFWCSVKVADAIDGLGGAHVDAVDASAGRVRLRFDPARRAVDDVVRAVEDRGFAVTGTQRRPGG